MYFLSLYHVHFHSPLTLCSFRLLSHECVRSGVAPSLARIIDRNLLLRRLLRLRRFRSFVLNEALRRRRSRRRRCKRTPPSRALTYTGWYIWSGGRLG